MTSICLLYPELLGTYGDGGNAVVLAQRLRWRGIDADIVEVTAGAPVPSSCDVYLMGGGEDGPQTLAVAELNESRALHVAVDRGAAVLAVCAGFQLLGESFTGGDGRPAAGLGLVDAVTSHGPGARRVGEIVAEPDPALGLPTLTGYENHQGVTRLGAGARPLGHVMIGRGNDAGDGGEGAIAGRVVGTYLHGPVLARNPALADLILSWVTGPLPALDDTEASVLRSERMAAAAGRRLRPGAT
ncbi:MAG: CobB/CobQ-like glutamine amidotransferase [Acidimicrobiales bacterium]|nr:CobB/CobQ-like glutamine amidotransferase [Acidimicrobiales bacterium]